MLEKYAVINAGGRFDEGWSPMCVWVLGGGGGSDGGRRRKRESRGMHKSGD